MIISGLQANKMHLKTLFCLPTKITGLPSYIVSHCFILNDVNLTISPLVRPITTEFTKGFSMMTSTVNILCL